MKTDLWINPQAGAGRVVVTATIKREGGKLVWATVRVETPNDR